MLYKSPDIAFGILDPTGIGHLTLDLILGSYVVARSTLSPEEITAYFELQSIFRNGDGQLSFTKFKEMFFPHLTLNGEDVKDQNNIGSITIKSNKNTGRVQKEMLDRVKKLNEQICFKISRNFTSVNKAFLTLDQDHDGLIEPKDVIALYGTHITIDYSDLLKIMESKNGR